MQMIRNLYKKAMPISMRQGSNPHSLPFNFLALLKKLNMLKVEVISKEMIKPSSPTPIHLRSFKLSLLDQLAPRLYIPAILFYTIKDDDLLGSIEVSQKLRISLSKALAVFYPLSGRIKDDDTIDCNDEGAVLFHARVNKQLLEFLKEPHLEILDQLVPGDVTRTRSSANDVLLAIQVSLFDCGGVAIGVLFSHKVGDGTTIAEFMIKWAAMAGCANEAIDATFVSASDLFPPRSSVSSYKYPIAENVVTRRLVLDASAIAALRAKVITGNSTQGLHPTRVEVVSALIGCCSMKTKRDKGPAMVLVLAHAVNLRGRMVPLLPSSLFGNLWVVAVTKGAVITECNGNMEVGLEKQLRDVIGAIDSDFIEELKGPNGAIKALEGVTNLPENHFDSGVHVFQFSSWCRFPFYEVDFGWGKPIWVSCCSIPVKNLAIFIGRRWDDGMEVWLNMEEDEMARFIQDQELLSFVSIPP